MTQTEASPSRLAGPEPGEEAHERLVVGPEGIHETQSCQNGTQRRGHTSTSQDRKQQQQPVARLGAPKLGSRANQLERALSAILLPFIFLFLLPTLKLGPAGHSESPPSTNHHLTPNQPGEICAETRQASLLFHETAGELMRAFIRLPLDRIRLQSAGWGGGGGLALLAEAAKTEIHSKSDLQEEEEQTHMMLLQAPAEHRASYVPVGAGGVAHHAYHPYGSGVSESGPQQAEPHVQAIPHPDYAGQGGGAGGSAADEPPGQGQGEASVLAESAGGGQQQAGSALQARSDLPAVRALNVKCEKNHMTVNIVFDRPFYGMVFSKGHYNDQKCVHLPPNSGQTSVNFDIHLGKCGMSSSDATGGGLLASGSATGLQQSRGAAAEGQQPNGVFIENTIIIQYDPLVQEIYDQARKLRCTWYDYYEKSVTFRPYNVDMLDAVTANFLGDNIQCWMQIQVGKGPWSSEVAGIVKIGQTMTMVLAIKDDENRFDMLVRNCVAHDGKHQPIQLVDEYGCVARPKIMGKFQKVRNFGPAATVVSYAHFQAFKFPDSMSVHFQCVIQVCRYECPEPVCQAGNLGPAELTAGGPSSSNGGGGASAGATNSGDYATSGTEMVASGEVPPPLPPHQLAGLSAPTGSGGFFNPTNVTGGHSHGSNVNLKLDESQGRVQVKLDTSMMAGLTAGGGGGGGGHNGRPAMVQSNQQAAGPLPPHLLHMAGSSAGPSSFYRPGATATTAASLGSPSGGAQSGVRHHPQQHQQQLAPSALLLSSRAQQQAPPVGTQQNHQQVLHFSPQFPNSGMSSAAAAASRRLAAYTNRLGDQAPPPVLPSNHHASAAEGLAPYEAEYPLSLIASPRGLRLGATGDSSTPAAALPALVPQTNQLNLMLTNNRVKRDAEPEAGAANSSRRTRRDLRRDDSTSVATHKTIQVVSPDDVAFSLLDPSEPNESEFLTTSAAAGGASRWKLPSGLARAQNSVCFSTGRFLWGVLVTLGALLASVVIVAYVILKQRSQLEQKLSTVYVEPPAGRCNHLHQVAANRRHLDQMVNPSMTTFQQQQQQQGESAFNGSDLSPPPTCQMGQSRKRQQEEVQQRNTYLARLYSQFAPSAYWR